MSLATVQQIQDSIEGGNEYLKRSIAGTPGVRPYRINAEAINKFLAHTLATTLDRTNYKGHRPWQIVNITEKLDPAQPWIGIEYETGFREKATLDRVIHHVWDKYNNSAMDIEGCGNYPIEITFSPVNMTDFTSKSYNMDMLIKFMNRAKIEQHYSHNSAPTGIHCNISTPTFRSGPTNGLKRGDIVTILNASLGEMSMDDRDAVFNRDPYSGFFHQSSGNDNWIEGKVFCTTDELATYREYKDRIVNLANLIETLCTFPDLKVGEGSKEFIACSCGDEDCGSWDTHEFSYTYITNFTNILLGKEEEPEFSTTDDVDEDLVW